jgi:hypothetical protein
MRRWIAALTFLAVLVATPALALNSGTDILVPAAGRGAPWVTDLYVMNPGSSTLSVTVSWLIRGQANPAPDTYQFNLLAGETAILDDVILNQFGFSSGRNASGAFLVQASGAVIVNSRIYSDDGSATFGQGFEGVPVWAATSAGSTTNTVGLSKNAAFRTNVYATAGADGASIEFRLLEPDGDPLATANLVLEGWEPYLRRVDQLFNNLGDFDNATLEAKVNAGSAVIGASKVDQASTDPTTLESEATGGGSIDGYYHFGVYDSYSLAAGGYIVIENGQVVDVFGTYFNYDKVDEQQQTACAVIFDWGLDLSSFLPLPVEDFDPANGGFEFTEDYTTVGLGRMNFTVEFEIDGNLALAGVMGAVGDSFSDDPDECIDDTGCNGEFPDLVLMGGKTDEPPPIISAKTRGAGADGSIVRTERRRARPVR